MKKTIDFGILLLLILPSLLALNIEKKSSEETIIFELDKPAIFELEVTNTGATDTFIFEGVPGFFLMDSKEVEIKSGETKTVELNVYAKDDFEYRKFFYTLQYTIRDSNAIVNSEELTVRVVGLENAIEIGASEIDPELNFAKIYIKNKENFNFENIDVKFSSPFFYLEEKVDLQPKEKEEFTINLDKEKSKGITAGFYTLKAELEIDGQKAEIEGTIKFTEKELVSSESKDYGFFILTKVISKENQGNVPVPSDTTIKKNIFSRLFTTFDPEPDIVDREGLSVIYTWNTIVEPGETLNIVVKTNWLLPLLLILLIVAIIVFARQSSGTDLIVRKKVSFVNTKGGEFALKISLTANAKKYVERINIVDKIPPLVKVYERFGAQSPTRFDENNRRIEWDVEKLEKGEVRVFSYIVYSKVGVLGKFALPAARIFYEVNGKIKETMSNRAFFVSEQRKGEIEDEY